MTGWFSEKWQLRVHLIIRCLGVCALVFVGLMGLVGNEYTGK